MEEAETNVFLVKIPRRENLRAQQFQYKQAIELSGHIKADARKLLKQTLFVFVDIEINLQIMPGA